MLSQSCYIFIQLHCTFYVTGYLYKSPYFIVDLLEF